MVAETSICRGDDKQQKSTRHQTENWTKNGVQDIVLGSVVSLQRGIIKAQFGTVQVYREATVYNAMLPT
jgi:hypothetical protein